MGYLYAIGDVHGCYEELNELMQKIYDDAGDTHGNTVVFVGDYIDRGPDSAKVIEFLIDLKKFESTRFNFVFLKGNHEDMLMKAKLDKPTRDDEDMFYYNGGYVTEDSYKRENLIYKDHADFYNSLERYYRHGDFFFVHAGINTSETLEQATSYDRFVFEYDPLLWDRAWNHFNGKFAENVFVVHGHTPVPDVFFLPNQLNIDTGCVFGKAHSEQYGQLTAVRLDGRTKEEIKVFQVRRKFDD